MALYDTPHLHLNDYNFSFQGKENIEISNNALSFTYQGKTINLAQIEAIWSRKWNDYTDLVIQQRGELPPNIERAVQIEYSDSGKFLLTFLKNLNVETLGEFDARYFTKTQQLLLARQIGFLIPDTILTNNKEELQKHLLLWIHGAITKAIESSIAFQHENGLMNLFTEIVNS